MMKILHVLVLGTAFVAMDASASCPGSPATIHAKCEMKITFPSTNCESVQQEIAHRMAGDFGWTDPHNDGTYKLDSINHGVLKGSRRTGNDKYTDLFEMIFSLDKNGDCVVEACSESQVTSVVDFSTNFCNLHNLYCSTSLEGCPIATHDLEYAENYKNCRQRDTMQCLSSLDENQY
jgi:hypothetical protein